MKNSKFSLAALAPALIATTLFAFCICWRNYYLYSIFCQKYYDLGIFLEIVRENSKGIINPWLYGRQVHHLSDHWTPIFILLGWLSKFFGLLNTVLLSEMLSLLLCATPIFWMMYKNLIDVPKGVFLIVMFYLNRDLFEAGYFPVHESTMAALPIMLLGATLSTWNFEHTKWTKQNGFVFALLLVLTFYSEQFAFSTISLGLGFFFLAKQRRFGALVFTLGVLFLWWCSFGRELFFTPIYTHYQKKIILSYADFEYAYKPGWDLAKTIVLHFFELAPAFYLLWRHRSKLQTPQIWRWALILSFFAPLIAGRLITAGWGLHYSVVVTCLWSLTFLTLIPNFVVTNKMTWFLLVFLFVFGNNKLRKPFQTVFFNNELSCIDGSITRADLHARTQRLRSAFELLRSKDLPPNSLILTNANLLPNLIVEFPYYKGMQLGAFKILSERKADIVLFERGRSGQSFAASADNNERVIERLKKLSNMKILIDEPDLFLAIGPMELTPDFDSYYPFDHPTSYLQRMREKGLPN